jgi:hypothetical protein
MDARSAKSKWCPHVRMALVEGMAANLTADMSPNGKGYANIHAETRCIADECMMWIWFRAPTAERLGDGDCGLKRGVRW